MDTLLVRSSPHNRAAPSRIGRIYIDSLQVGAEAQTSAMDVSARGSGPRGEKKTADLDDEAKYDIHLEQTAASSEGDSPAPMDDIPHQEPVRS